MSHLVDAAKNLVAEKVADMPKPEAAISDVDVKNFSRQRITLNAKVDVKNPYSVSLPICEVSYSLKSAGREIVLGTMEDPGSLPGGTTTMLEVPVIMPYSVVVSLFRDIVGDWDIDYTLDLKFTIDLPLLGNFTIPLSTTGEIKLPTIADIF